MGNESNDNYNYTCAYCGTEFGEDVYRWVVMRERQRVITPPEEGAILPEVVAGHPETLANHCSERCAMVELNAMLASLNASATWADVGPIEKCSSCREKFYTSKSHLVITILQQRGPDRA